MSSPLRGLAPGDIGGHQVVDTKAMGSAQPADAPGKCETGDMAIEAVANEVGYEDASFFGRLFRRSIGLTPAQYRLRFGLLRRALARA